MKLLTSFMVHFKSMKFGSALTIIIHFLTFWTISIGEVQVTKPHHPLYIQTGHSLELVCKSARRTELRWARETPGNSWVSTDIVPTVGSDFSTQNCVEEPDGFVESSLLIKEMTLDDRGLYLCQDESMEFTFGVFVTMLHVHSRNVTVDETHDKISLFCMISGFEANVPDIRYAWMKDGEDLRFQDGKYEMVLHPTSTPKTNLIINHPSHADQGVYSCLFTLATDKGPLTLQENVHVDASSLDKRSSASTVLCSSSLVTFALLASLFIKF